MRRSNGRLPVQDTAVDEGIAVPHLRHTPMRNLERHSFSPATAPGAESLNGKAAVSGNGRATTARNGRAPEIARPELPVETFRVESVHHGPCACPLCGEEMQQITTTRERWSQHLIVRAQNVAVYRCEADDFEQSDLAAQIAFLSGALDRIEQTADRKSADALRRELAAARSVEKLRSSASAA